MPYTAKTKKNYNSKNKIKNPLERRLVKVCLKCSEVSGCGHMCAWTPVHKALAWTHARFNYFKEPNDRDGLLTN